MAWLETPVSATAVAALSDLIVSRRSIDASPEKVESRLEADSCIFFADKGLSHTPHGVTGKPNTPNGVCRGALLFQ
jgi:hypothetical protein